MRQELLDYLRKVTPEEREILDGQELRRDRYAPDGEFIVDSGMLLKKGKLIEIRPHTRFVHFPAHRHNYVELVYMCAGSTTHIIDREERLTLREGDLLFLNQNAWHEILPASEGDLAVNFIILPEFFHRPISMIERENVLRDFLISTLAGETGLPGFLHIQTRGIVPVENLIESMIWTLMDGRPGINTINQTSMGLLLMNLSKFAESINRDSPNQAEQTMIFSILQYIETHYQSGTLSEVSAMLHQSDYTVSRLLKKRLGQNFKELLQARKLQQAAYLLGNTALSIDAVMEQIGYDNSSFFYRRFRDRYHCSPGEYRRSKAQS